jgi:hypothetical protein
MATAGQPPQVARVAQPDLKACFEKAADAAEHLKPTVTATVSYGIGCFIEQDNPLLEKSK